jgi:thiamine pyrophosphate-dependent acetolactate synthase large subunit-like protein
MANRHMRGLDRAHIGTAINDPPVDYAKVAEGMGIVGIGPITDPKDLGPALRRAVPLVKSGQPVLIDVVTQGR